MDVLPNAVSFPFKTFSSDNSISSYSASDIDEPLQLYLKLLDSTCTGVEDIFDTDLFTLPEIINKLDSSQGVAPLHYACMNGHITVVQLLLQNGADINIWDVGEQVTPLICACAHGHLEIAEILVENGCDVNAGLNNRESSTALLWAVRKNQQEVVRFLLESNADQNSTVLYSETPIHAAVIVGSTTILKYLIEKCKKTNVSSLINLCMDSKGKYTPLHLACSGGYPNSYEICKILIELGNASVNVLNFKEQAPLHLVGIEKLGKGEEITKLLLANGALVNAEDKDGRTPLFCVAARDGLDALSCMEVLIKQEECKIDHQDNLHGYTPLHIAALEECKGAVEKLLMSGADFSIKSFNGTTALAILLQRIPHMTTILERVFDNAVSHNSQYEDDKNPEVTVDYKYVTSLASPTKHLSSPCAYEDTPELETLKSTNKNEKNVGIFSRILQNFSCFTKKKKGRKEISKIKCLIDQDLSTLLVHPVIHSFLTLKWQKAWPIFLSTLIFKLVFVFLLSSYIDVPYYVRDNELNGTNGTEDNDTFTEKYETGAPIWFIAMYAFIVTLALANGLLELFQVLHTPKSHLRSLEPWITVGVIGITITCMHPKFVWSNFEEFDDNFNQFSRSMAALGIFLAWADVWLYMGRFPNIGLSIRVYHKVFHNFAVFILPHFCLMAGFAISLTIIFPKNGEFFSLPFTVTKLVRIMAGDFTIPGEAIKMSSWQGNASTEETISHYITVYVYTAYVLMVGIVLMNMLIGLAVYDIQGIYSEATINRLCKQAILLNALESSFTNGDADEGKWSLVPKRFAAKYVNLFTEYQNSTIMTFRPFDQSDTKLCSDLKVALLNLGGTSKATLKTEETKICSSGTDDKIEILTGMVNELIISKENDKEMLGNKMDEVLQKVAILIEKSNM